MPNNIERFTQPAQRVLILAQDEAERLQHNYIGTEHVLLGLMREQQGVAYQVLNDMGLQQRRVEELVEWMTRVTTPMKMSQLELSPGTKRLLELAVDEARRMKHHYVGTEHVLLGLVRQSEGVAVDVLKRLGVSPEVIGRQTRLLLQGDVKPSSQSIRVKESATPSARLISEAFAPQMHSRLLLRLLSELSQTLNEAEKHQMRQVIERLFDDVISVKAFSEEVRERLLDPIIEPFKPLVDDLQERIEISIEDEQDTGAAGSEE